MFKKFLGLSLLLVTSQPLLGQGFSFSTHYSPEVYDAHPQNWAAIRDTNGILYIGNGDGFLTFNGVKWESYHIGERGRGISFFESKDGTVFINGQYDFGYLNPGSIEPTQYSSNHPHYVSLKDQFENPDIWEVNEIQNSIFLNHSFGVIRYDIGADQLTNYPIKNNRIWDSFQMGDSIIVDTNSGLWVFKDSVYHQIPNTDLFLDERLYFAIPMEEGKFLLGSKSRSNNYETSTLTIFDGTSLSSFDSEAGDYLSEHKVFDGIRIDDETYAIATLSGGVVFINRQGELLKIYNERSGLYSNSVYSLYLDDENFLWINLSDGIQKLDLNENIWVFDESTGVSNTVTSITENDNSIYVTTLDGPLISKEIKPEKILSFEPLEVDVHVNKFITWKGETYLYGMNGLFLLDGGIVKKQIYNKPIAAGVESETDTLTFLYPGLIIEFDGKEVHEKKVQGEMGFYSSVKYEGDIYAIRDNDFVKIHNGKTSVVPIDYDTSNVMYINKMGVLNNKLLVGIEGSGTNLGLFEFNSADGRFQRSAFLSNYPDFDHKSIFTFEQCSDSEIWFSANRFLIKASKTNSDEWVIQKSPYQLAKKKNVYAIDCGTNDDVWIGGTKRITRIGSEWNYQNSFKTNITGVYLEMDSLIYGGYGEPTSEFIIPYENNELRFLYAAASFISPEDNQYQVKLEGFDSDWSDWTLETQKDYTNIPEGDYTFKVRSKNVYEVAGSTDSIQFTILPPWYRTWWAYLLYTIIISGILYLAYKIRINQILKVQRIRNRIASDLHDEVSATLSSISYFAQAIQSKHVRGDKNRFVNLIAESAGDAKEKITDIVWAINPEHDNWTAFLSKCRRYASDLVESKDIKYSLKIVEHIPGKLDMQLRQHLWLIFKEMLTNAVRHSDARHLDVIMAYQNGKLKLVVQDDGIGMDVDEVKKGNGLVNIQKRAEFLKGRISLTSHPGFGTRWNLEIPLG